MIGPSVSVDLAYVNNEGKREIMMRANTIMESQYYLVFKENEESLSPDSFFTDENYIGLCAIYARLSVGEN